MNIADDRTAGLAPAACCFYDTRMHRHHRLVLLSRRLTGYVSFDLLRTASHRPGPWGVRSVHLGAHLDQDGRIAGWSGPSSNENNPPIISLAVTLPFKSFSATTSCWASGSPT